MKYILTYPDWGKFQPAQNKIYLQHKILGTGKIKSFFSIRINNPYQMRTYLWFIFETKHNYNTHTTSRSS